MLQDSDLLSSIFLQIKIQITMRYSFSKLFQDHKLVKNMDGAHTISFYVQWTVKLGSKL